MQQQQPLQQRPPPQVPQQQHQQPMQRPPHMQQQQQPPVGYPPRPLAQGQPGQMMRPAPMQQQHQRPQFRPPTTATQPGMPPMQQQQQQQQQLRPPHMRPQIPYQHQQQLTAGMQGMQLNTGQPQSTPPTQSPLYGLSPQSQNQPRYGQMPPMPQQHQQRPSPPAPRFQQPMHGGQQQVQPPESNQFIQHPPVPQFAMTSQNPSPAGAYGPMPPMPQQQQQQPPQQFIGQPPVPQFNNGLNNPQQQSPQAVPPQIPFGGVGDMGRPKVHPDALPNPGFVQAEDQLSMDNEGVYFTSKNYPPHVTSAFTVVDDGNSTPRFVRCTSTGLPCSADQLDKLKIPLALVIQPLAELRANEAPVPVVDAGQEGPVRCTRCQAYINPHVKWQNGGQQYQCNICEHTNATPPHYFCNLDMTGRRSDVDQRPELKCGTVEFVATPEFCLRTPVPAAFIFAVDVSFTSIQSGMLQIFVDTIKEMLDFFPSDGLDESPCKMGIITFDRTVHFYNLNANISQPQMLNIADIDDVFMPLSTGFLVNPVESRTVIEALLDQLPQIFSQTRTAESCLGAATQAALKSLTGQGGRVILFQSSLPTYGPGMLKNRNDVNLYGTDKERTMFAPQDDYFMSLGQACCENGVGIDMFMFPQNYIDVASIGALTAVTGGQSYLYPGFNAQRDGDKFAEELRRVISRPFGYDGLLRVRCSNGMQVKNQFGNFHMKNSTDMEFGVLDSDKAIAVEIKFDGKLDDRAIGCFQIALLYTTMLGQRRIRIMNLALPASKDMGVMFRFADMDTVLNFVSKAAITDSIKSPMSEVCKSLTLRCVQVMAAYRQHVATSGTRGQMILPESLKLYAIYVLGMHKSKPFRQANDQTTDQRVQEMRLIRSLGPAESCAYFYPMLYRIDEIPEEKGQFDTGLNRFVFPPNVRTSLETLDTRGIFLLENGQILFMWIGKDLNPQVAEQVFGVKTVGEIDPKIRMLPVLSNGLSEKIRSFISHVQDDLRKGMYCQLNIVRQGDPLEAQFMSYMVEDPVFKQMNHVDFMCRVHESVKEIIEDA